MTGGPALRVLYFAWLRERAGTAEEAVPLPPEAGTVGALMDWLAARDAAHAAAFEHASQIRCAVNQVMAGADTPLSPGDEVAFFPPVTGG